jgi:hypothetical protein
MQFDRAKLEASQKCTCGNTFGVMEDHGWCGCNGLVLANAPLLIGGYPHMREWTEDELEPRRYKAGDTYIRRIRGPMRRGGPREVVVVREHDEDEDEWNIRCMLASLDFHGT